MEDDPNMMLQLGEGEFELNRRNGFLYTFLGQLAIYDHLFFLTDREASQGYYVFKTRWPEAYDHIGSFMVENLFTAHINAQEVSETDKEQWELAMYGDVRNIDSVPSEWEDGTT